MKKLITIFTILLASCTSIKKDEFVNPIFYKTMYPVSITAWKTKLTPTSYISQNDGKKITGNCILLENEQNYIKLKCEMQYPEKNYTKTEIIKYEISINMPPYLYNENEQEIIEYTLENETSEKFSSKVAFSVNTKE